MESNLIGTKWLIDKPSKGKSSELQIIGGEPGDILCISKDGVITMNYEYLIENYSKIRPDYVITKHLIKMKSRRGRDMYDLVVTVNKYVTDKDQSPVIVTFDLFKWLLGLTHTPKAKLPYKPDSDKSYISEITSLPPSLIDSDSVPNLSMVNVVKKDISFCYLTPSESEPYICLEGTWDSTTPSNWVKYVYGPKFELSEYTDAYDEYGIPLQVIRILESFDEYEEAFRQCLKTLVCRAMNLVDMVSVYRFYTCEEIIDIFRKHSDTANTKKIVHDISKYNLYDCMPEIPFRDVDLNSIEIDDTKSYTNEEFQEYAQLMAKKNVFVARLYFENEHKIIYMLYQLKPQETEVPAMNDDELKTFLRRKK